MKKISIKIEVRPLKDCDISELSNSNKVSNELIHKITEAVNAVDTSKVYFDISIGNE